VIQIEWTTDKGRLLASEPTAGELVHYSPALSAGYNDPANAELMGHQQPISPAEVVESYVTSLVGGMRAFLLFVDDALVGDGDLRNFRADTCEFAFMIAAPSTQGKGLGTAFATMIHAFGFRTLGMARIYASVVPHNTASRRVFEKLGYVIDDSEQGREYAEEPKDVVLVLHRDVFMQHCETSSIQIGDRTW
jgi:RimJ/RimL family protein N-acetyltransferase